MDLRKISNDKHIAVYKNLEQYGITPDDVPFTPEQIAQMKKNNFAFKKVEILSGNIGYLKFNMFEDPIHAAPTASAALNFLINCDAIIMDLRYNGGGEEEMVKFILSYFFPKPTLLKNIYNSKNELVEQSWTLPYVPGETMFDTDLYVLTSGATASGAEAFSFDVKCFKRGKIIGEVTKGMAHMVKIVDYPEITEFNIRAHIPYKSPENPDTKSSWEGVGVQPDLEVPAEKALATAHLLAMQKIIEKTPDDETKKKMSWEMVTIDARYNPVKLDEINFDEYTGEFENGKYAIVVKNENLYYRYNNETDYLLYPLITDLFGFEGDDNARIKFSRDKDGGIDGFKFVFSFREDTSLRKRTDDNK
jgi:hypothetical protein